MLSCAAELVRGWQRLAAAGHGLLRTREIEQCGAQSVCELLGLPLAAREHVSEAACSLANTSVSVKTVCASLDARCFVEMKH